jgi:hypothetical protein
VHFVRALLTDYVSPFGETNVLNTLNHQVEQCQPSSFLASESRVKIFDLKSRSMNARKYLGPNHAWLGAMCPVISFVPFSIDSIRLFHAFFDQLVWHAVGTQRSPANVPVELGCCLSLDKV